MKNKRYLFAAVFLFCSLSAFAQITDTQLIKILQEHKDAGHSQVEIMEDLERRGVSIQRLKMLEQKMKNGSVTEEHKFSDETRMREQPIVEQVVEIDEHTRAEVSRIFGQNLFLNKQLNFAPNLNVPVPDDYILGPGDEVIIDVWGNSEFSEIQVISPEGDVVLPNVGLISLSGLKMKDASKRIKITYGRVYSDLNAVNGDTHIKVSLGKLRGIQVNILGEVSAPGTYSISSLSSVFHALYVAGGVSPIGSLRNIQVFRSGKLFKTLDVYEYLLKGQNNDDVILNDGDVVLVGTFDVMVNVKGAVKRPMKYEMKVGETIDDLLYFAGGFANKAFTKNIQLSRDGQDKQLYYTIKESDYKSFDLKNGDEIEVATILPDYENKVEIIGAVYRAGEYAIGADIKTVKDLIEVAGGLKGDAFRERAILYRQEDDYTKYSESFSIDDLLSGKAENFTLKKNDVLYIPTILTSKSDQYITVRGSVVTPGKYTFVKQMQLEEAIIQAGGMLESAYKARVDVYRRNINNNGDNKNSIKNYSFSMEDTSQFKDFILEPYDEIFVYQSPWYKEQDNVSISGEVLFPGTYAKISEEERVSSLLKRAGGVTDLAYIKGARLIRQMTEEEYVRSRALFDKMKKDASLMNDTVLADLIDDNHEYVIGLNFENIMKHEGSKDDIVLRKGDKLVVPSYNGIVKVSGAVANQVAVPYVGGKTVLDYIDMAGGYAARAARCKKYVVYMNGRTQKLRYAHQIQPGCEIVVPLRKERRAMSTGEVVGITSSVVSLATVLTTLIITLAK